MREASTAGSGSGGRRSGGRRSGGSGSRSRGSSIAWNPIQQMMERTMQAAAAMQAAQTPAGVAQTAGDESSGHLPALSASALSTSSLESLNRIRFLTGMNVALAGSGAQTTSVAHKKYYYRVAPLSKWWPEWTLRLRLTRLQLLAMFDRNKSVLSAVFDVTLAVAVALLAALVLSTGMFVDHWLLVFAIVVAGAQFSLLKSVQPDAASPIHGYNWIVTYSRAAYFCLCALVILLLHVAIPDTAWQPIDLYHMQIGHVDQVETVKNFFIGFLLFLPIAFTIGLLPQVNTFGAHVLEQIDMHLFGGTASFGLTSAALALAKSLLSYCVLFTISYVSLEHAPIKPSKTQSVPFSAVCALLCVLSFLLSRSTTNHALLWCLIGKSGGGGAAAALGVTPAGRGDRGEHLEDPLIGILKDTATTRLKHDLTVSFGAFLLLFGLHCSTVFYNLGITLLYVLIGVCAAVGLFNHYLVPQLRKHTPWLLFSQPLLRTYEHRLYETNNMARLMWFERVFALLSFVERNLLYPLLVLSALTVSGPELTDRFGPWGASLLMMLAGLKVLRTSFCNAGMLCWPLISSTVLFLVDLNLFGLSQESKGGLLLLGFYLLAALWPKLEEVMLKLQYMLAYVAPWQISWGSAFHAFAQPFAVPHSALTLAQTALSSVFSAPINPFLGSSFFVMSYVRPVKFWEKDYNTRRIDHSNTRLITHIDRGPMTDDSNLNAIFYEHLTRSLQKCLAGDLALGRWATPVAAGDCFILASFYLNCLVHIIEVGNGFVTFQLRGLEFRGTYCQQREVEAISEDIAEGEGCCCCEPGRLPGLLSFNTAWALRWLAWEVTTNKYVVEGYSITDNSAVSMLQVHELRRLLVTLYVKCIVYYTIMSPKLEDWLSLDGVMSAIEAISSNPRYVDVDPIFSVSNDEDYDMKVSGISRSSFCHMYLEWIAHCAERRGTTGHGPIGGSEAALNADSPLVALCLALSLVGRRTLGAASHNRHSSVAESFLYGLHALFKGDFRITCSRDEWVFADMDMLRCVVAPAVRMALKLHQDHFTAPDDFEEPFALFERVTSHEAQLFISHEHDPAWRQAILANTPSLLALRHVFDDGQDDFKVIMLNRRHLNFRVIKLNKECVRAFWSGQQQELIYLRNRNPERGSIQNARQVLRNMINSSADQPIGYPIYVSPLTTSFIESHPQLSSVVGPPLTCELMRDAAANMYYWLRVHCGTSGSTSVSLPHLSTPQATVQQRQSAASASTAAAVARAAQADTPLAWRGSAAGRGRSSTDSDLAAQPSSSLVSAVGVQNAQYSALPAAVRMSTAQTRAASNTLPALPEPTEVRPSPLLRSYSHSQPAPTSSASAVVRPHLLSRVSFARRSSRGSPDTTAMRRGRSSLVTTTNEGAVAFSSAANTVRVVLGAHHTSPSDEGSVERVRIRDVSKVYDQLNQPLGATGNPVVFWPKEHWRKHGGKSGWDDWTPANNMEGSVVHRWTPSNLNPASRSHIGQSIYLLQIEGKRFVPIAESAVISVSAEV